MDCPYCSPKVLCLRSIGQWFTIITHLYESYVDSELHKPRFGGNGWSVTWRVQFVCVGRSFAHFLAKLKSRDGATEPENLYLNFNHFRKSKNSYKNNYRQITSSDMLKRDKYIRHRPLSRRLRVGRAALCATIGIITDGKPGGFGGGVGWEDGALLEFVGVGQARVPGVGGEGAACGMIGACCGGMEGCFITFDDEKHVRRAIWGTET